MEPMIRSGDIPERWRTGGNSPAKSGSADWQQQVDDRAAPIELDARPRAVAVRSFGEPAERGADQRVHLRGFTLQPQTGKATARQRPHFQAERLGVISRSKLDAHTVLLLISVDSAVVLPPPKTNRALDLGHPAADRLRLIGDALEHHRNLVALNENVI